VPVNTYAIIISDDLLRETVGEHDAAPAVNKYRCGRQVVETCREALLYAKRLMQPRRATQMWH
jgi:hypothetical protein